jgi:hypothetical protein
MRIIAIIIGLILSLLAAFKVYGAIRFPGIGPELVADATLFGLGAVACFAIFVKVGKKKRT